MTYSRERNAAEYRAYIQGHTEGYDKGRADQKREDDQVIAKLFSAFDEKKHTSDPECGCHFHTGAK